MKRILQILVLITGLYSDIFSQSIVCPGYTVCLVTIDTFPAPVNIGSAVTGPNYGCLSTQLNPSWYWLEISSPGFISIDIHSVPACDVDFICWGPFTSNFEPCTTELKCAESGGSHHNPGPGGGYPLTYTVDCSDDPSSQEWCYIPDVKAGEYYILLVVNNSNANCNIIVHQIWEVGSGSINCSYPAIMLDNITISENECDTLINQYTIAGSIIYRSFGTITGEITIVDQPSGISQTLYPPFTSPTIYNLQSIPIDGLQHTLTATFSESPACTYSLTYRTDSICVPCSANAGENITVCGLVTNINAIELPTDSNTYWIPQDGICFYPKKEPSSNITAETYGTYNIVWQTNNYSNFTCSDTVTVEFIDPALCTDVKDDLFNASLDLTPNPVINDLLIVKLISNRIGKFQIRMIDINGRIAYQKEFSKQDEKLELHINTKEIKNGFYIIEINDGNELFRKSILIQSNL